MPEPFVPMHAWLRPRPAPAVVEETVEIVAEPEPEPRSDIADDVDRAVREARRFRAALADMVEERAHELFADLACEVLGRELQLEPCELKHIVARAVDRYATSPVRVRVNPLDAAQLCQTWSVISDESLRTGDIVLETASGVIDATLEVRLARVLADPKR